MTTIHSLYRALFQCGQNTTECEAQQVIRRSIIDLNAGHLLGPETLNQHIKNADDGSMREPSSGRLEGLVLIKIANTPQDSSQRIKALGTTLPALLEKNSQPKLTYESHLEPWNPSVLSHSAKSKHYQACCITYQHYDHQDLNVKLHEHGYIEVDHDEMQDALKPISKDIINLYLQGAEPGENKDQFMIGCITGYTTGSFHYQRDADTFRFTGRYEAEFSGITGITFDSYVFQKVADTTWNVGFGGKADGQHDSFFERSMKYCFENDASSSPSLSFTVDLDRTQS